LPPFETVAQPAIVPELLIATATLAFGSSRLSLTIPPAFGHVVATMEPDDGSSAAPTIAPVEFTAVA
jgi:hypothetical protein